MSLQQWLLRLKWWVMLSRFRSIHVTEINVEYLRIKCLVISESFYRNESREGCYCYNSKELLRISWNYGFQIFIREMQIIDWESFEATSNDFCKYRWNSANRIFICVQIKGVRIHLRVCQRNRTICPEVSNSQRFVIIIKLNN